MLRIGQLYGEDEVPGNIGPDKQLEIEKLVWEMAKENDENGYYNEKDPAIVKQVKAAVGFVINTYNNPDEEE